MPISAIPIIDPSVKYVGVSKLRELNATKLKEQTDDTLVFQDNDKPLAVLLSYEKFLIMQQQLMAVFNTLEFLTDEKERNAVFTAMNAVRSGHFRPLKEIEAELEKK
jgi:hypothetical protein